MKCLVLKKLCRWLRNAILRCSIMKTLSQDDIIRIMREEWDVRVAKLSETVELTLKTKLNDKGEQLILSPELKVMHKKSGIRYTIDSVGPRDVILRTPEGEQFIVDAQELENEYELD